MSTVQTSSVRATFLPAQLNIQVTKPQTPFVTFSNGVKFFLQNDGNLVVYHSQKAVWAAHSNCGSGSCELVLRFQDDGNLVEYCDGRPKWETGTAGKEKQLMPSDSPPYLTVLDADGNIAWNSQQDKKPRV